MSALSVEPTEVATARGHLEHVLDLLADVEPSSFHCYLLHRLLAETCEEVGRLYESAIGQSTLSDKQLDDYAHWLSNQYRPYSAT